MPGLSYTLDRWSALHPNQTRTGKAMGGASAGGGGSSAASGLLDALNKSKNGGFSGGSGVPGIGGSGGAGGAGGAGTVGGGTTNFSGDNPDIDFAAKALKERYAGDNGAGRAMDLADSKIRDSAEGERRAMAAGRTARGVSGTGVDDYNAGTLADKTQRQIAGTNSDIALQSEQAKTGLLSTLIGAGSAQGNLGVAQRGLAIQQYTAEQQAQQAREQGERARELAILQLISQNM